MTKATAKKPPVWRNRIVGYSDEAPDQLLAHPNNWRIHPEFQQDAMRGVLSEVGVVQNIIVNRTTQHVVDGHLRISLALRDGQATVPVTWVELSVEEEALVLATIDPLGTLAATDPTQLNDVLQQVSTGDAALQQMLDEMSFDAEMAALIAGGDGDGDRTLGDKRKQVKVVLCVDQLSTFERAILLTDNPNRGEAITEICEAFIHAKG